MSKKFARSFRPLPLGETKRKKSKTVVAAEQGKRKNQRPPAVYSNKTHEETMAYYDGL